MKKLLILIDDLSAKKQYFFDYLERNMSKNVKVYMATLGELLFYMDGLNVEVKVDSLGLNIRDFDLVYIRRAGRKYDITAGSLALCLDHFGIKFFDRAFGNIGPFGNKLTSFLKLSISGLPTIPSYFCFASKLENNIDEIIKKLGLPLVAKELSTQRGHGVFLVKTKEDFAKLPKKSAEGSINKFMFQKFIESDEEYRILILKDKIGAFERKIRTDPNEFRSNVALGSREEFIDVNKIPAGIADISKKGANVLNLQIAGADVMVDKHGKYWLLEVNRGPGLTYDPELSPELASITSFFESELQNKND